MTASTILCHESSISPNEERESFLIDIPYISNLAEWEGWSWIKVGATWIEPEFTNLQDLSPHKSSHLFVLRKRNDPSEVAVIYPFGAHLGQAHISRAGRDGDSGEGLYLRARRTAEKSDDAAKVLVVVTHAMAEEGSRYPAKDVLHLVGDCISAAKEWYAKQYNGGIVPVQRTVLDDEDGPMTELAFCTWSSLGEHVRPTYSSMQQLCRSLASSSILIKSFILDDGWLSRSAGPDTGNPGADAIEKTLMHFKEWQGLGASLREIIEMVKREVPSVKRVAVWMTLLGYWHGIHPDSPLIAKYDCQPYTATRANLPGLDHNNHYGAISHLPSGTKTWYLPSPTKAALFWRDWFTYLKKQGVSWVKVDNQASLNLLEGSAGAACEKAMWEGMTSAAKEVFGGSHNVLNCMAHSEETWNGPRTMGFALDGDAMYSRNSDDYGRGYHGCQQEHIFNNVFNSVLTSQLNLIPDGDMFMTAAQAPHYHVVLRALMPGPVLLSDKPNEHDMAVLDRIHGWGTDNHGKLDQVVVKTAQAIRPIPNRIFEARKSEGGDRALKGFVNLDEGRSIIAFWNVNREHGQTHDSLSVADVFESLRLDADRTSTPYAVFKTGWGDSGPVAVLESGAAKSAERLLDVSVGHLEAETMLVTPFLAVGKHQVAVLGTLSKVAGMTRCWSKSVLGDEISCCTSLKGYFGFLIRRDESNSTQSGVQPEVSVKGKKVVTHTHDIQSANSTDRIIFLGIEIEGDVPDGSRPDRVIRVSLSG